MTDHSRFSLVQARREKSALNAVVDGVVVVARDSVHLCIVFHILMREGGGDKLPCGRAQFFVLHNA